MSRALAFSNKPSDYFELSSDYCENWTCSALKGCFGDSSPTGHFFISL